MQLTQWPAIPSLSYQQELVCTQALYRICFEAVVSVVPAGTLCDLCISMVTSFLQDHFLLTDLFSVISLRHVLYSLTITGLKKSTAEQVTHLEIISHYGFPRSSPGVWGSMIKFLPFFWHHLIPTFLLFAMPPSTCPFLLFLEHEEPLLSLRTSALAGVFLHPFVPASSTGWWGLSL